MWRIEQLTSYGENLEFIYKGTKMLLSKVNFDEQLVTQHNHQNYMLSQFRYESIYPVLYSMNKMTEYISCKQYNKGREFVPFVELFHICYGIKLEHKPIAFSTGCWIYENPEDNRYYKVNFINNQFEISRITSAFVIERKPLTIECSDYLTLWQFNWRRIEKFVDKTLSEEFYSKIGTIRYFHNEKTDLIEHGEICGFDENMNPILLWNRTTLYNVIMFDSSEQALQQKINLKEYDNQ